MTDAEFAQKFQLANVFEAGRDLQNALRLYGELYTAHPDRPGIADGYVRVLCSLKKFGTADSILTERLTREPANTSSIYLLIGRVRALLGKKSDALDAFQRSVQGAPEFEQYVAITSAANAMIEVGYNEEALALLQAHRSDGNEADQYSKQIAELLFKINRYGDGTDEYLKLLRANSAWIDEIERRLSAFTIDTNSRRSIIKTVISHIDTNNSTTQELKLLGWCYGEQKDYSNSLAIALKIDKTTSGAASGYDLYHFAEKALAEGALEAASLAYREAASRIASSSEPTARPEIYFQARLGSIKADEALAMRAKPINAEKLHAVVSSYTSFANESPDRESSLPALVRAAEIESKQLHEPAKARELYEQVISRSRSRSELVMNTYFSLEESALELADIAQARLYLDRLETIIRQRNRPTDIEISRHIDLERGRMDYYDGSFDTALTKLTIVAATPASDFANDAIALKLLIEENRESSSDPAMKVFAKADLLSLGSDLPAALKGFQSIRETFPKSAIADEATLRAADLLVRINKPSDAVALLEEMQEKMTDSPLLDRAAFREAEITEYELALKDKALKLYEDFLARYPKSSLCTEVRQRARKLRGDVF